jgi:hypothetical protein
VRDVPAHLIDSRAVLEETPNLDDLRVRDFEKDGLTWRVGGRELAFHCGCQPTPRSEQI